MFEQLCATLLLARARAHISTSCRTLLLARARAQVATAIPKFKATQRAKNGKPCFWLEKQQDFENVCKGTTTKQCEWRRSSRRIALLSQGLQKSRECARARTRSEVRKCAQAKMSMARFRSFENDARTQVLLKRLFCFSPEAEHDS